MKKLSLSLLTLTVLVLSSSVEAIKLDDCSFGFKTKRFFNPISKMHTREKNKELSKYAQDSVPSRGWIGSLYGTSRFFNPSKEYVSEILYLIEHGANPNISIPYRGGNSIFKPIYLFIENNDIESTRLLLEHGAHVDEPIIRDMHPLAFAHTKEMAELLMKYGAKTELTYAEYAQTSEISLLEAICSSSKYAPDLIPLYLNQIEEEKREEQAQIMLNRLFGCPTTTERTYSDLPADTIRYYASGEFRSARDSDTEIGRLKQIFKQKTDYLIQFGAQLPLMPNIIEKISSYRYSPEDVQLYFAQLEEEQRKEHAQTILNNLVQPDNRFPCKGCCYFHTNDFKKKMQYLIETGAQLPLALDTIRKANDYKKHIALINSVYNVAR